jgi:hypothetical protein
MLAGDELAPADPAALAATGFLVRNYKMLSREKWLQDTVEHTFLAFQGVTLGCARCHDHFFDAFKQSEYYRVRAIFAPHEVRIDRVPGTADRKVAGLARVFDAKLDAKTLLYERGDERTPIGAPLEPGVPAVLGGTLAVTPVTLPTDAIAPDRRPFVIAEERAAALAKVQAASPLDKPVAEAQRAELEALLAVELLEAAGHKGQLVWRVAALHANLAQRFTAIATAQRALAQGTPEQKAAVAQAKLAEPTSLTFKPRAVVTYPATSTGRRAAFARWLTTPTNPLTARVAVNHLWLRHFDTALVPSVFDFGTNGRRPTHPALLDWLAAEFMHQGWRMKPIHRLLVTSHAYRQASTPNAVGLAKDADNVYLWRFAPRRLEAEAVRDSVLAVTGQLDRTFGGPELDHALGLTTFRRSVYYRHAPEKQMEFLKLFDAAAPTECYQRKASIVPQQALALANSPLCIAAARVLARQIGADDADAFVTACFERILSRPPSPAELAECRAFVGTAPPQTRMTTDPAGHKPASDPSLRRRESLVLVLLNHHELVTLR